jgi:hypothetical protein
MNNENENQELNNSDSEVSENVEETESGTCACTVVVDSVDYSQNFENIQTLLIFISALLVAYGLAFAFFKGFKR